MTESKIYADNFKCSFGNSDQFLDFLKERKEKSLWMKAPSNSLQFKPLEKDSELGNLYAGAIEYTLEEARNSGHLFLPRDELIDRSHTLLNDGYGREVVSKAEILTAIHTH